MTKVLEQINTDHGRFYKTPEGNVYPSVTTIVGIINKKEIDAWKTRVGEAEAKKVSERATTHGTRWHELLESYLKGERELTPVTNGQEFWIASHQWLKKIYPHISDIKGIEKSLWSDKLQCAGTIDLIASWDGVPSIIDWKTTKHLKQELEPISYWAQTAAYAYEVYERMGYFPQQSVLVFNQSDTDVYFYKQPTKLWLTVFRKIRQKFKEKYE